MSKPDLRSQVAELVAHARANTAFTGLDSADAKKNIELETDAIMQAFANHLEEVDGRLPEKTEYEGAKWHPRQWCRRNEAIDQAHQVFQQAIKSLRGEV